MPRTDIDLNYFQKRLDEERARIQADIEQAGQMFEENELDSSGEISSHDDHLADIASDLQDREQQVPLRDNLKQILDQIDRAQEKMNQGTYGICDVTNQPIPVERLEFEPYATTTVEGQEQLEARA